MPPSHYSLNYRTNDKNELERDVRHTRSDMDRLHDRIQRLEETLAQHSLLTMALWELVQKHTSVSQAEVDSLVERLAEERAKEAQTVPTCDRCGRVMSRKQGRCLYCPTVPT